MCVCVCVFSCVCVYVCVWGVCVGGCVSVAIAIVKRPVLPLYVEDGRCTNFLYDFILFYYHRREKLRCRDVNCNPFLLYHNYNNQSRTMSLRKNKLTVAFCFLETDAFSH